MVSSSERIVLLISRASATAPAESVTISMRKIPCTATGRVSNSAREYVLPTPSPSERLKDPRLCLCDSLLVLMSHTVSRQTTPLASSSGPLLRTVQDTWICCPSPALSGAVTAVGCKSPCGSGTNITDTVPALRAVLFALSPNSKGPLIPVVTKT